MELGGQWKAGVGAGGQIVGRYWSWWATGVRVLELVGNWWSGIGAGGHCWAGIRAGWQLVGRC